MAAIDKMVLRKIWRMKLRSLGISLVIAVAASMFISGLYTADVLEYSTERFIVDSHMPDMFIDLTESVNASDVERVMSEQSIETYQLRLVLMGQYFHKGETFPAIVLGVNDPSRKDINRMELDHGAVFGHAGEGVVIAGMEGIGADAGKIGTFLIAGHTLDVNLTGTVRTPEFATAGYMAESYVPVPGSIVIMLVDLSYLQSIAGPGINNIILMLDGGSDGEGVISALSGMQVKGYTYQKDTVTVHILGIGIDKMRYMFPMFSIIFMVVGFISIFMTSYRLVMNDSRFIGVLMSLGYTRVRIVASYLLMGLLFTAVGSVLGAAVALLFTYGIVSVTMDMIGSFAIAYPLTAWPFLLGFLFTFVSVMVSVAIPVMLVTRTSVREALEYKASTRVHTIRFNSKRMRRSTLMGIRNTTRNPLRMIITVLVVGMTVGVAGSWLVMTESAWGYMNDSIDAEEWDMRLDLATPMERSSLSSTLGLDNSSVQLVSYTGLNGIIKHGSREAGSVIMAGDELPHVKNFNVKNGRVDMNGALITSNLARQLDAGVGDTVAIAIGNTTTNLRVEAVVYDLYLLILYTTQEKLSMFFPPGNCTGAYLTLNDPDTTEQLADQLRLEPEVSHVTIKADIVTSMNDLLDQSQGILYMMFFLSLAITFVVSASAVILSTMERDVEFATLDTLGVRRIDVVKGIMVEMMLLGTISAIVGIPFAYLFAKLFAILMEKIIFYFPVTFVLGATVITFSAGLAFILLSALVPVRYSGKLDTESTIRERMAG